MARTGRDGGIGEQPARQLRRPEVAVIDLDSPGPEVGGVEVGVAVGCLGDGQALVDGVGAVVDGRLGHRGRPGSGSADARVPGVDRAVFRGEDEQRRVRLEEPTLDLKSLTNGVYRLLL